MPIPTLRTLDRVEPIYNLLGGNPGFGLTPQQMKLQVTTDMTKQLAPPVNKTSFDFLSGFNAKNMNLDSAVQAGMGAIQGLTATSEEEKQAGYRNAIGGTMEAVGSAFGPIGGAIGKVANVVGQATAGLITNRINNKYQVNRADYQNEGYAGMGYSADGLNKDVNKYAQRQGTIGMLTGGVGAILGGIFGGKKKRDFRNRQEELKNMANQANLNSELSQQYEALGATDSYMNQYSGFNNIQLAKKGGRLKRMDDDFNKIADGVRHSRKNSIDLDVTSKGVPVITYEEGGEIVQHAEIEVNELILSKTVTNKIEELRDEYMKSNDESILIELGKYMTDQIMRNTIDSKSKLLK